MRFPGIFQFQPFLGHLLSLLELKTNFIKFCTKFQVKQAKFLPRSKPVQRKCLCFFKSFQKAFLSILFIRIKQLIVYFIVIFFLTKHSGNEASAFCFVMCVCVCVCVCLCVASSGILRNHSNISDGTIFSKIAVNYFCEKAPSQMFDWFVNTPPTPNKNYKDLLTTKYFILLYQTVKEVSIL